MMGSSNVYNPSLTLGNSGIKIMEGHAESVRAFIYIATTLKILARHSILLLPMAVDNCLSWNYEKVLVPIIASSRPNL